MGVGGNFWDILKPFAKPEGPNYIRNKRVAIDLSYWIVQHETAINKSHVRNPHLRLAFFRTINLFSKYGAYPVFVVDGVPSPKKSQARILRFSRLSGIDTSSLPMAEEGVLVERNQFFTKCVQECMELLELLGIPVIKARGEAEALCAQLNRNGHVDACITADSDTFLYGAKCVIKCIRPNSREPFECYHMSDIEVGLGLKRNHLIAISLLVGSDYDRQGVQGIGPDTAVRFVRSFSEDEILDRLHELGGANHKQNKPYTIDLRCNSVTPKVPHCSQCGHPGSKKNHLKTPCKDCNTSTGQSCLEKAVGFTCDCSSCKVSRRQKEQKKHEDWQSRVCKKISMEQSFPDDEIIKIYLNDNHGFFSEDDGPSFSWENPNTEMLIDFLAYHQLWDPSYIRQRILPMLSTIFLREMAISQNDDLLIGQYEFHSIQRVKIRLGLQFFVVNWKKAARAISFSSINSVEHPDTRHGESEEEQEDLRETTESSDLLDELSAPLIQVNDGCWFLLTDENIDLVQAAFPEKTHNFLQEEELKEAKRRRKSCSKSVGSSEKSESSKSKGVQLSITEFYSSTKPHIQSKLGDNLAKKPALHHPSDEDTESSKDKRRNSCTIFSKSARRRLLFPSG